ncbi:hypothetical protein RIF29_14831 [Crotalaria pallida]|uniref:Macrophage migration inhibitory factor n=1 Tax=Crotalaria pallida TaxID=3830 RepID=A0AAN9FKU2_CROPI
MPCLNLSTNVNLDGVDTSSILSEATSSVASLIGKPQAYVMIVLKGSVAISFGGTEQPAAYGELVSIGGLNPDVNKKLSAAISSILETKLSVPKSRFFLKFYDTKASPSESRICTMFACFTPALDHVNKSSHCEINVITVEPPEGRVPTLDLTDLHYEFHVTLFLDLVTFNMHEVIIRFLNCIMLFDVMSRVTLSTLKL